MICKDLHASKVEITTAALISVSCDVHIDSSLGRKRGFCRALEKEDTQASKLNLSSCSLSSSPGSHARLMATTSPRWVGNLGQIRLGDVFVSKSTKSKPEPFVKSPGTLA